MSAATDLQALRIEQDAFDSMLDELMVEHAGQFVVFHGGKPTGFFYPTHDDAYRAGLDAFGTSAVFLVSEIRKRRSEIPSISWYTGAMSVQV